MDQKIEIHQNYLIFNFVGGLFTLGAFYIGISLLIHILLWVIFINNLFAVIGSIMYVDEKQKKEKNGMIKYHYRKNTLGKKYKARKN